MNQGIIFAILAACAFGFWTVFHQQASSYINQVFGAIIVSLTAVILGLFFLLPGIKSKELYTNPKGIFFLMLAGLCAFAIDYFALKAYGTGLKISVGGPIIIGGSVAIAAIIGLFLGESFSIAKAIGILMVLVGSIVLSLLSK